MTVLADNVLEKFVPTMVTAVPTGPLVGEKLEMTGLIVKLALLVATFPATETVMGPVFALAGTVAVNCVEVAAVTVAATPLNWTISCDGVALNPLPLMVTDVAGAPPLGEKLVIEGSTVKAEALVAVP